MATLTDNPIDETAVQGTPKTPLWRKLVISGCLVGAVGFGVGLVLTADAASTESAALEQQIADIEGQIAQAEAVEPVTEEEAAQQAQSCAGAGAAVAEVQTQMASPELTTERGVELAHEMAQYVEGGEGPATAPWVKVDSQCEATWTFLADYEYTGPSLNVVWLMTAADKSEANRDSGVIAWATAVYNSETKTFSSMEWGTCPLYAAYAPGEADGLN